LQLYRSLLAALSRINRSAYTDERATLLSPARIRAAHALFTHAYEECAREVDASTAIERERVERTERERDWMCAASIAAPFLLLAAAITVRMMTLRSVYVAGAALTLAWLSRRVWRARRR